jgi:hypothetical protein
MYALGAAVYVINMFGLDRNDWSVEKVSPDAAISKKSMVFLPSTLALLTLPPLDI